ncbi:hypothetical protein Taro_025489 [Colocasia esculenta]|uniref:Uncharacterized protein n=1 Tax=Colocasia esculenta TaxID=4460 RepID=A0A843VHQ8_COLES|nr:hypothetical protein [Colocasia esculenta]
MFHTNMAPTISGGCQQGRTQRPTSGVT